MTSSTLDILGRTDPRNQNIGDCHTASCAQVAQAPPLSLAWCHITQFIWLSTQALVTHLLANVCALNVGTRTTTVGSILGSPLLFHSVAQITHGLLEDENGTTSRPLLSRLEPDESEEGDEDEEEREANKLFEEEEKRIAKEVARQEAEVKRLLKESSRSLGVDSEWSEEDVCDVEEEEEEEEEVEEEEAASEPLLAGKGGGGKNEEEEEEEASDEEEEEGVEDSTGYTTDDPALENISMIHEAGLTDAEGALSDVNSAFEAGLMGGVRRGCGEGGGGGDDDNTSLSSRASSRVFGDSDAMMSLDSLSALYDSDNYDNCCYADDLR
ncbi:Ca(2+)/calmodulin-responsive adenylate cyclase-like [Nilaparvata lugens]|uniref:Ca(2+)/calmodulin-responsive adenylate cyclase-like n=1 Tax=Nilaparvata lugens TaxID=108931 RepID=UPI00193E1321|nr:Ca(2+)/calmodulin-responsive adenylate cyclase-like [Nilaparvata lugens]